MDWGPNGRNSNNAGFLSVLYLLRIYIDSSLKGCIGKAIITIDNASIHLTSENKILAALYGLEMHGIPEYWPHLAPVEYIYGMVKGFIRNKFFFCKELDSQNHTEKKQLQLN